MTSSDKPEEPYANIHFNLESVRNKEGIIGYILRDSKSAVVDINDSTKIIDYAMLSSETFDIGEVASETFELGSINSIIIEGNDIKILSLICGDQRLSIFMDKKVDHNKILKELDPTKQSQKRNMNINQNNEENQAKNEVEVPL